MAKKKNKKSKGKAEAFSFGDPSPVLDSRDILELMEATWNGKYYEPPITMEGLAKSFSSNAHHSSAIYVKRNILLKCFKPHKLLAAKQFSRWALESLIFGNGYVEQVENRFGKPLELKVSPAKYTRVTKEGFIFLESWNKHHVYEEDQVFHLMQPDINQEIYGAPEYLAGLQSAWLNESATLFRRKYYLNGSHAGFMMYMTDASHDEQDIKALRDAMKDSKGLGNFKNLFMYAPNGKKDGIQILPISEVQAKDEFFNIKNVTRDDVMAAHRVPPQLMGIMPANAGGFGDVEKAAKVFAINELEALQIRFEEINEWIGEEVVQFDKYEIEAVKEAAENSTTMD